VPGVGSKTAAALLEHFGSLDGLLERLAELPFLRLRGAAAHARRIEEHRELALLCRDLATIHCAIPLGNADELCRRTRPDAMQLERLCADLRIGPSTRRRIEALRG
jgi:5'-3' exonuclease